VEIKMTDEQKNRLIAEKVMGWVKNKKTVEYYTTDITATGYGTKTTSYTEHYTPTTNTEQAIQALEAFDSIGPRLWHTNGMWSVLILISDGYKCRFVATNKSLSAAICDALCKAVRYE
jgi:hypothetical protein